MSKKSAVRLGTAAAALAALSGGLTYLSTRLAVDTALARTSPRLVKQTVRLMTHRQPQSALQQRRQCAAQRLASIPMQAVSCTAKDGVRLTGLWYPCEQPQRIILAMHGWRSSWSSDFCLMADFLHENHCSILFAQQRGQNDSEGASMGLGVIERYDCLSWVDWLLDTQAGEIPIYLCGISMRATAVMLAAGLGLPPRVHGVIADCGFTSPDDICRHVARDRLHVGYGLRRVIAKRLFTKRTAPGGFSCSTVDALRQSRTPLLLIHGTDDRFVPVEMTYRNYLACRAPKRLLIVPGASHGMSCVVDRARYTAALLDFWRDFD